jgi:hypothetical protein
MDDWPTMGMDHLSSRMIQSKLTQTNSVNGFDPYQVMLKRNRSTVENDCGYINTPVQQYDPKDIQELEEFCQQYGIVGFNFGKMHPKSALQMLRNKMGIVKENTINKKMLCG